MLVHGRLIKREGTVCTFECSAGHTSVRDYSKGNLVWQCSTKGLCLLEPFWQESCLVECQECGTEQKLATGLAEYFESMEDRRLG